MRITGGLAKGILLQTDSANTLRPATDYNRQALFSSIESRVQGSNFLDLFAGTGAYGLEAFSRGAEKGTFVEMDKKRVELIKKNILSVAKSAHKDPLALNTVCSDVFKFLHTHTIKHDLIFIDPPYELYHHFYKIELICNLLVNNILNQDHGICIFEGLCEEKIPAHKHLKLMTILGKSGKSKPKLFIYEYIQ